MHNLTSRQKVLDFVDGLEFLWKDIKLGDSDLAVSLRVSSRAVRYGEGPRKCQRPMVTAIEQQLVADVINASMLTPKLCDAMWLLADITLEPVIQVPPGSGHIAATADPGEWNNWVDLLISDEIAFHPDNPLIVGECKDWVLSSKLRGSKAVNYGFHSLRIPRKGGPFHGGPPHFLTLWQQESSRHNDQHVDPTQCMRFVMQPCRIWYHGVEQQPMSFSDLITHPSFYGLVSEKPLHYTRQPRAPVF